MCRVGLSLYQMLDGELISGQDVLYYFIGGWYVSRYGLNTGGRSCSGLEEPESVASGAPWQ